MSYAPGSIMDPVTNLIDATVCDPFPLPDMGAVNTEALVADIYRRMPAYLWHFIANSSEKSSVPVPVTSQAAAMEEENCTPGPSAQPPNKEALLPSAPVPSAKEAPLPLIPAQPTPVPVPAPGPSAQPPTQRGPPARETPIVVHGSNSETSPASSEVDDFTTVQSKSQKRKLKASKSHANPPKKVGISPSAVSQKDTPTAQTTPVVESQDSPMEEPPRDKIPPLFIRDKLSWMRILPKLDQQSISFSSARSTAIGIRVQCPSSDDHRSLTKILRAENIGYHTYALPDERVLRVVIRGLPRELDTELIKEDLLSQELPVREVHRMYGTHSKKPLDLVLVISDLTTEGKRIHRISSVCRLSGLKVEAPKNNGKMGQCHRCQLYGHSARNCFAHPRCVKCLGDHGTSDCSRKQQTEEPPSCVLCRTQGHPANYRGCPKAPKEAKRRVKPVVTQQTAPAPTFVPAPAPATSAWDKPLPRATPPASTPVQATAAPPAKPVQEKAPMPPPPRPQPQPGSPPQATAADRAPANLNYLRYILSAIDVVRMDQVVRDLRANPLSALEQHWEYLRFIDSLQKSAP